MKKRTSGKSRRAKGTGCLFRRGRYWYVKWTSHGITRMESTRIEVGSSREVEGRVLSDRQLAESYLLDKTEPLRMRHREDALALLMRQLSAPDERLDSDYAEIRHRTSLGDLADAFRSSPRRPDCSEQMLGFYTTIVNRLADALGRNIPVAEFTHDDADAYAVRLAREVAPSTFNKHLNALALVWKICAKDAGVEPSADNPWQGITRKRLDTHVRRAFTREETDRILAATSGEMHTLIAVLLYTGLRMGDACQLRWEDFKGDAVFVLTAKRNRRVAIPIHPALAEAVGERKPSGFVMPKFAAQYQTVQGRSSVSRTIKNALEKIGIATSVLIGGKRRPDAGAHSFRHTFATRWVEAGIPPEVVREIVGHATVTMTEHYTHLSDEHILEAFHRLR